MTWFAAWISLKPGPETGLAATYSAPFLIHAAVEACFMKKSAHQRISVSLRPVAAIALAAGLLSTPAEAQFQRCIVDGSHPTIGSDGSWADLNQNGVFSEPVPFDWNCYAPTPTPRAILKAIPPICTPTQFLCGYTDMGAFEMP